MRPLIAALCLAAAPAFADGAMSGAEFEAHVTGRTLTFGLGGQPYGVERYLPGRRVIWAFVGSECRHGVWYEEAPGRICFTYEHDPAPQCWRFYLDDGGLRARFEGDIPGDLIEVDNSPEPMICPGPEVGV